MFEVKKKADRSAIAFSGIITAFFLLLWLYLFMYGPDSGDICSSSISFLIVAAFMGLIALGLSIPNSVRISEESIMLLRGSSIDSEVTLKEIEKVEVIHSAVTEVDIFANGEKAMRISESTIGAEQVEVLVDKLKSLSEKHHFPVIEKKATMTELKEEMLEKRDGGLENMKVAADSKEEELPYKIK